MYNIKFMYVYIHVYVEQHKLQTNTNTNTICTCMMYCTCTVYKHVTGTYTLPILFFRLLLNMYIVGLNSTVILLSNDKNLLNKARVCKITAFDRFVSISENKSFKGKKTHNCGFDV